MRKSTMTRYPFRMASCALWLAASCAGFAAARPPNDPLGISLSVLGTFGNGAPYNKAAAIVVAHDLTTQRLFVVNQRENQLDVLSIAEPAHPVKVGSLDMSPYGGLVTGVAACGGLVAVCAYNEIKTSPGRAVFVDADLNYVADAEVGASPDLITFSPDGRWVLVANEGEPNTYNDFESEKNGPSIDPEGSITVIDLVKNEVRTATFTAFNGETLDPSIRIFGPKATVAQDLEPEAIAISADSTTAYVTLQENNAMAVVDIASASVTSLVGLGFKDWSRPPNVFDASDRDNSINIRNWPVWGMYLPDEVARFDYQGQTFLIMANEGDARDYPGFNEEVRVGALNLDATAFPNKADLIKPQNLGRLNVTKTMGDVDGDGDYDALYAFGARSFTIRNAAGAVVFDSAGQFEQLTAALYPDTFNCSNNNNTRDSRSPAKGPEPEGVVIGKVAGRTLAFIALERIGGIVVYNVSDPFNPQLVDYFNNRNMAGSFDFATAGDLAPEGMKFISADASPNGKPMLVVANEVSGTVTLFQVNVRAFRANPGSGGDSATE